jgi:flagellar motility protein MotE (MotC chaperone)
MKNLLILGLLALLLFSVSAALSLWLNQSKQTDTTTEKDKDKDKEKAVGKGPKESGDAPKPPGPKTEGPPPPGPESSALVIRDRESKLALRAAQLDLVIRDLQSQRESTESALRQVMNELKNVSTETTRLDALAEDLRKKKVEFEAGEKKNIEKIAAMYDAMTPEAAAPILKQMADNGRLEMAAKILVQMKERNAARVLEAVGDPALALQILEKMRGIRAANPPAPGGAVPVVPAKGP